MSTVDFKLPENLTIANVHGLHEEFESLVDTKDCDKVILRGDGVTRADTAGLQLLVAFVHATKERQIQVDWDSPSEKLCSAAGLLGVGDALGIH
ncbi:STAS domain-containing protein [Teredinibacter sp. KSP-S5-2]|uniref:STAS domain-containing protein n=1 Tax=Teredinibacter sp. KSP-S5-2 TaxID=3034506 RepID=UPI002934E53D|nr:STAS domain-containing protein [Teredinibacter sp. KSP-S5-2]WNO07917.1 STAS domain-containing protein [Teredinibacter sp. KSP-S5-2]